MAWGSMSTLQIIAQMIIRVYKDASGFAFLLLLFSARRAFQLAARALDCFLSEASKPVVTLSREGLRLTSCSCRPSIDCPRGVS